MSTWQPGARVGPYTLLSVIGVGAMGEVWKARDERLNRLVAIKRVQVRSEAVAREARAITALNHPYICTLHDIGPDYLVMESSRALRSAGRSIRPRPRASDSRSSARSKRLTAKGSPIAI